MELEPFGIDVVVIEPGAIATDWSGIARESLLAHSGTTVYARQAADHAALMEQADRGNASDPKVVADAVVAALRAKRPKTRYAMRGGAFAIRSLRTLLNDRAFDALLRFAERSIAKRSAGSARTASARAK
jgi:short-subunit dehydrogenase